MMQWTSKLRLTVMEERNDLEATIPVASVHGLCRGDHCHRHLWRLFRRDNRPSPAVDVLFHRCRSQDSSWSVPASPIRPYASSATRWPPSRWCRASISTTPISTSSCAGAMSTATDQWIFLGLLAVVVVAGAAVAWLGADHPHGRGAGLCLFRLSHSRHLRPWRL